MSRDRLVARVPSLSNPRVRYDVVERRDGALVCECPAFGSWRKRGQRCWHLRVLATARAALDRCKHADGALCADCLLALVAALTAKVKKEYVPKPPPKRRAKKQEQADVALDVEP